MRLALMDPMKDRPEGTFKADEHSIALLSSPYRVAMILDCMAGSTCKSTHFECRLTEECLEAVQKAHLIKQWPKALMEQVEKDGKAGKVGAAKTSASSAMSPKAKTKSSRRRGLNSPKCQTIPPGPDDQHPDHGTGDEKIEKNGKVGKECKEAGEDGKAEAGNPEKNGQSEKHAAKITLKELKDLKTKTSKTKPSKDGQASEPSDVHIVPVP